MLYYRIQTFMIIVMLNQACKRKITQKYSSKNQASSFCLEKQSIAMMASEMRVSFIHLVKLAKGFIINKLLIFRRILVKHGHQ